MFAQKRTAASDALNREDAIRGSISCLMNPCRPHAIFKEVALIVVHALNRPAFFPRPHIVKKVLELSPSVANRYAPAAVSVIFVMFWILAPIHHVPPANVNNGGSIEPCGLPMFVSDKPFAFTREASTRFGVAVSQAGIFCGEQSSAIAAQQTHSSFAFRWRVVEDNGSCKSLTNQGRFSSRHNGDCFTVLFSGGQSESLSECPLRFSQIPV